MPGITHIFPKLDLSDPIQTTQEAERWLKRAGYSPLGTLAESQADSVLLFYKVLPDAARLESSLFEAAKPGLHELDLTRPYLEQLFIMSEGRCYLQESFFRRSRTACAVLDQAQRPWNYAPGWRGHEGAIEVSSDAAPERYCESALRAIGRTDLYQTVLSAFKARYADIFELAQDLPVYEVAPASVLLGSSVVAALVARDLNPEDWIKLRPVPFNLAEVYLVNWIQPLAQTAEQAQPPSRPPRKITLAWSSPGGRRSSVIRPLF